jgi:WD40 repeat protein
MAANSIEEALSDLDAILAPHPLNNLQELIVRHCWEGKTYAHIAELTGYDDDYIRDVGFQLWRRLSQTLGEKVSKSNFKSVLRRHEPSQDSKQTDAKSASSKYSFTDWGMAADVPQFYGRVSEFATLRQWILQDRCQLISVLGIGGIGKSTFTIRLSQTLQNEFEGLIWRSLLNAPPFEELIWSLIQVLSERTVIELPPTLEGQISCILTYLQQHRILLVFDNVESIFESGTQIGRYAAGYESYSQLFKAIAEVKHKSCLLLTSREKPRELTGLEGTNSPVRSLKLQGLSSADAQLIFTEKGCINADESDFNVVCTHYDGNPLALKIVASAVQETLGGNLKNLHPYLHSGVLLFNGVVNILNRQFERLSELENQAMYWLAIHREPISIADLVESFPPTLRSLSQWFMTINSLSERCIVEHSGDKWFLQPVILEYTSTQIIQKIKTEIIQKQPDLIKTYSLIKAQGKEYIRQSQIQLILLPLIGELNKYFETKIKIIDNLIHLLDLLKNSSTPSMHAAGNIINLLIALDKSLEKMDFSDLPIWEAYLVNTSLKEVNFSGSSFHNCAFLQRFSAVLCVVYSPDGSLLATSNASGQIQLWRLSDGQCISSWVGHANWIRGISFSGDGQRLLSVSDDRTAKLWDVYSGTCLKTFCINLHPWSAYFSPDGQYIVTAHGDYKIRIWNSNAEECLTTLEGHSNWVIRAVFSPDGKYIASGGADATVRIWNAETHKCLFKLEGHQAWIIAVKYSPDGQFIASAGLDCTIRIWDAYTGECLNVLQGHTGWVWSLAFSPDSQLIISAGVDRAIRVWSLQEGRCQKIIKGHTEQIWSVACHPNTKEIVSGAEDNTIRLWDTDSGECLSIISGTMNWVNSLAFRHDGQLLSGHKDGLVKAWDIVNQKCHFELSGHTQPTRAVAYHPTQPIAVSGGDDQTIRVWNLKSTYPDCIYVLKGHVETIWTLAYSLDGLWLASAGHDHCIRLWNSLNNECLYVLKGHSNRIHSVAFSPCSQFLASASEDKTVKLWNLDRRQCIRTLTEHTNSVVGIAFHPTGAMIASGDTDCLIKLWSTKTGDCLQTLTGHTGWILSLSYSACGRWLISSSNDRSVKIWDAQEGNCVHTFVAHTDWVWAVATHPTEPIMASAGSDEIIRVWDLITYKCIAELQTSRPYEKMNISGIEGLTDAQKEQLKLLGAFEEPKY